jgi:Uma2 family endonuclease
MTWVNTSPLVKTYTLDEFWELPESPDHSKLELIAGVLYMTPPPGFKHDRAVSNLIDLLSDHIKSSGKPGRLYVPRAAIWTSPNTYLEPDLLYLSNATEEALVDPDRRTTADLVVEVISPGSAIYDRNTKADTYAALGVKELWLVDESIQIVEVRTLDSGKYERTEIYSNNDQVESRVLKGFWVAVEEIFVA